MQMQSRPFLTILPACLPAFLAGWMDGWMPNQAAPLRYVKECAKRSIISSRFIMPEEEEEEEEEKEEEEKEEGEEDLPTEAVESMLASSETCHGIFLSHHGLMIRRIIRPSSKM